MNNEILEISKWLSEKGFEPDMWYLNGQYHYTTAKQKVEYDGYYRLYNPYFTLNRALELLKKIAKEEKKGTTFQIQIIDSIFLQDNIHLAALRLLKKTVEEGYVKPI